MAITRRDVDRLYTALRPRLGRRVGAVAGSNATVIIPPHTHSADQISFIPCDSGRVASENVQDAICELDSEKLAIDGTMEMTGHLQMGHQDIVDALNLEVEEDATVGSDLTMLGPIDEAVFSGVRRITMTGIGVIEEIRTADFDGSVVGEGIINKPRVIHMDGDHANDEAKIDGLERVVFNNEPTASTIEQPSVVEFNETVVSGTDTVAKRGAWGFDKKERTLVTYLESKSTIDLVLTSRLHKIAFGWVALQCVVHPEVSAVVEGQIVRLSGVTLDYNSDGEELPTVELYDATQEQVPAFFYGHRVVGLALGDADVAELCAVLSRGRWHTTTLGGSNGDLVWWDGAGFILGPDAGSTVRCFVGTIVSDDAVNAIVDVDVQLLPTLGELSFMATVTPEDYFVPIFHEADTFWTPGLLPAVGVTYDPSSSGMESVNAQAALEEIAGQRRRWSWMMGD